MRVTRGELKKFINEELSILLSEETDFTKLGYTATDDEIKAAYNALTDKEKAKVDDPNAMYDRTAMIRQAHQQRARHGGGSKEAGPGPIDYKSYDELTDDQRKRVDQSVNTEIRALDMEGIEASDRAKARWQEKYTKNVQDDDAKKAATDATISQKKGSASAGEAKEDEWMKILKDKYIDVEVMGLPQHGSEYEGKPLPGGKLAVKMVSDVAKELADAGTPVPEEFIQTQRARLVPRDIGHKQGPEIGSAEEKRATAALKLKNFMRSNQGRTPQQVAKDDEDYRWRQKNDPNFFRGAASGGRAKEKRAKEMAAKYGGGWKQYADMSEPQRRDYAKRMDDYESEQQANARRDRENERAKRLRGKPAVGSKMNMDTFGGAKFESKKGNTNMRVTRGELKQIINEELEAQILRENIISDLVDQIKDSGEDAADWVKKNAKKVAKAAASAGESVADFADDVVQGALKGVDKTTGTRLSRRSKRIDRQRGERKAAADQDAAEIAAAEKASDDRHYAKQQQQWAAQDAQRARDKKASDEYWAREKERNSDEEYVRQQKGQAGVDQWKADRQGRKDDYERGERGRRKKRFSNQEWGEVNESALKKAIQEELAKVLQGK
jgi:hypothetical protein